MQETKLIHERGGEETPPPLPPIKSLSRVVTFLCFNFKNTHLVDNKVLESYQHYFTAPKLSPNSCSTVQQTQFNQGDPRFTIFILVHVVCKPIVMINSSVQYKVLEPW